MVVFSLTLVRHGETTANREMVIQGHRDVPLSERGLKQVGLVGSRLKNERFTHIFASDLKRAAETAQAIAEASTACDCSVRLDSRLRERKFGMFEGKSFKEFHQAAKQKNVRWTDFTPDGAESLTEVRKRARQFFHELCELMAREGSAVDGEYRPASIKSKRQLDSSLSNGNTADNSPSVSHHVEDSSPHTDVKECSGHAHLSLSSNRHHAQPLEEDIVSKRPRTDATRQGAYLSSDASVSGLPCDTDVGLAGGILSAGLSQDPMARSNSLSSSSGCSSLQDSVECTEADGDLPTPTEEDERDTDSNDTGFDRPRTLSKGGLDQSASRAVKNFGSVCVISQDIVSAKNGAEHKVFGQGISSSSDVMFGTNQDKVRSEFCPPTVQLVERDNQNWVWDRDGDPSPVFMSSASQSQNTCPNVSLSPLLEHRITSFSSVSSGRNSSFDDADLIPVAAGEVLVVSHGGLLKELVAHFIEDFQCKVPGGKSHALRICPNTGVSRFMVSLSEDDGQPTITCLLIHDKDHLRSMSDTDLPLGV